MAILDTLGREETTTAEVSLQMWMYNAVYSNQAKELWSLTGLAMLVAQLLVCQC